MEELMVLDMATALDFMAQINNAKSDDEVAAILEAAALKAVPVAVANA